MINPYLELISETALAMDYISADPYDNWLKVAMGLKHFLGESGFIIWNDWSNTSDKYDEGKAAYLWNSIQQDGGVTLGTIIHLAKQNGYNNAISGVFQKYNHAEGYNPLHIGDSVQRDRNIELAQTANRANDIWSLSVPASPKHPYLVNKNIKSHGIREFKSSLAIPLYYEGKLATIFYIKADGTKWFAGGSYPQGAYFIIGNPASYNQILLAEGYATAATLHEELGMPVVVTFSCTRFKSVGHSIRLEYPNDELLICGDNDHSSSVNTGLNAAKEAAEYLNCQYVVPDFTGLNPEEHHTDFNDYYRLKNSKEEE